MKKLQKKNGYGIAVFVLAAVCLILLSLILARSARQAMSKNQPWLGTEAGDPDRELLIRNVYITESGSGKITFLYENEPYTLKGKLKEPYRGVADIQIKKQKIQKIFAKRDSIEGTLLSYTDKQIEVEGYGFVPCADTCHVYAEYDGSIRQIAMPDLIVGSSKLCYIVAEDKICAVIQKEKTKTEHIRVLLKNGDSVFWPELYMKGSGTWSIDSIVQVPGASVDILGYMKRNSFQTAVIGCSDGYLYRTGADGAEIGSGYEGSFYVRLEENGCVIVNELPVEDYVRYVLPSEMPETFSAEALKAQAICARTFAYSQMKSDTYAAYGANVDDTTAFQVYHAAGTKEATDRAVKETEGMVIVSEGELITCYYFSTSPGVTEDMEVWQSESPAYLAKRDTTEAGSGDLSSAENFAQFIRSKPAGFDQDSPFYRWTAKLDIAGAASAELGKLKTLLVSKRSTSGFVLSLTASYENGSQLVERENDIRRFMGQYLKEVTLADGTVRTDFSMIPSACFEISEISGSTLTLTGGGFGHDIGMSQYGADAMGRSGKNCMEIIDAYYQNVSVQKIEMLYAS